MLKLSRAGWNNVIIFGVLAFILVINATHDNVFEKRRDSQPALFPNGAVILMLTINETYVVERLGKQWQSNISNLSAQGLSQMMKSWQQIAPEVLSEQLQVDQQLGLSVVVELASLDKPIQLKLFMENEQLFIFRQQDQTWFVLPAQIFSQLIPNEIFS